MKTISMLIGLLLFFLVGCAARQVEETTVEAESVVVSEIAPPSSEETPTKVEPVVTLTTPETTPPREEPVTEAPVSETVANIQTLQPYASEKRAVRIAGYIDAAAEEFGIDSKLQAAVIMRESSYAVAIEQLRKLGRGGEKGLTQIHQKHLVWMPQLIPPSCGLDLIGAQCQIRTGASIHAYWRDKCGGPTIRWVAAYGIGACPTLAEAKRHVGARTAYIHYRRIGGTDSWTDDRGPS